MNLRKAWPGKTKLKGQIAEYILNHKVLTKWVGFSLVKRVCNPAKTHFFDFLSFPILALEGI